MMTSEKTLDNFISKTVNLFRLLEPASKLNILTGKVELEMIVCQVLRVLKVV